jgi:hypothetical protein
LTSWSRSSTLAPFLQSSITVLPSARVKITLTSLEKSLNCNSNQLIDRPNLIVNSYRQICRFFKCKLATLNRATNKAVHMM